MSDTALTPYPDANALFPVVLAALRGTLGPKPLVLSLGSQNGGDLGSQFGDASPHSVRKAPTRAKTATRLLPQSAAQRFAAVSTAKPRGWTGWPVPVPNVPTVSMTTPLGSTWTMWGLSCSRP